MAGDPNGFDLFRRGRPLRALRGAATTGFDWFRRGQPLGVLLSASLTTSTRAVPQTAALLTADQPRSVPQTALLQTTTTRSVGQTAVLLTTGTRTVPQTAAVVATSTRSVAQTVALSGVPGTRTVPQTALVLATAQRSVAQTALVQDTGTRAVPAQAALLATSTRSVPQTAGLGVTSPPANASPNGFDLFRRGQPFPFLRAVATTTFDWYRRRQPVRALLPTAAAVPVTGTRAVPQTARLLAAGLVRSVPQTAALLSTTRNVPQSVALQGVLTTGTRAVPQTAALERLLTVDHVFVIAFENTDRNQVLLAVSNDPAPYLRDQLKPAGADLQTYTGLLHPSEPNYIMLWSGDSYGVTDDQGPTKAPRPLAQNTIVDLLEGAGKTWKSYQEDFTLANVGIGADNYAASPIGYKPAYAVKHNPAVFFTTVRNVPARVARVVDLTQLTTDLASKATTPNLVYVVPSMLHEMHDDPTNTSGAIATGTLSAYTGGPPAVATDSTKTWTASRWQHWYLQLLSGTGAGQTVAIADNTTTTLTLATPFTVAPDATSTYRIYSHPNYPTTDTSARAFKRIGAGDAWLQYVGVPLITSSPAWQSGRAVLLLWWDESASIHDVDFPALPQAPTPQFWYGPTVRAGATTSKQYSPYNTLRTIEYLLGLGPLTANDAGAEPILGIWANVREVPQTIAVMLGRAVVQTALLQATNTREVPQAALLAQANLFRPAPQTALLLSGASRPVPQAVALVAVDSTRQVAQTAALLTAGAVRAIPQGALVQTANLARSVPQTAATAFVYTRTVSQSAALATTANARSVPQAAGVLLADQARGVPQTVALVSTVQTEVRLVPQTALVQLGGTRPVPQTAAVLVSRTRSVVQTVALQLPGTVTSTRPVPQAAALTVGPRGGQVRLGASPRGRLRIGGAPRGRVTSGASE